MKYYYLNTDSSQNPHHDHEVHTDGCPWMPSALNRKYLGYFNNAVEAVSMARTLGYKNVDGCATCCPEAHKH